MVSIFTGKPINTLIDWRTKKLVSLPSTAIIPDLTGLMKSEKIRTMPILDAGKYLGTITQADVARYLPPENEILPTAVLRKKGFDLNELYNDNFQILEETIAARFAKVLNIPGDEAVAVVKAKSSLSEAIKQFTQVGKENRRYRTLVVQEEDDNVGYRYVGVLSYLDVFEIILEPSNKAAIQGFLDEKIESFYPKQPRFLDITNKLNQAVYILDHLPFTHIPISKEKSEKSIYGLVDESIIRALQYRLIYNYLSDMSLEEILKIQRPSLDEMTIPPSATVESALNKFVQSKMRPKTLLIGTLSSNNSVDLKGTLSFVDLLGRFSTFISDQKSKQDGNQNSSASVKEGLTG